MFRFLFVVFLLLPTAENSVAQINKFRLKPHRIKVGAVYHFVKTNIDGTQPEQVALYLAAQNRLEAFKYHPQTSRAGLVIAEMDWQLFSAKSLQSWQVFRGGEKKLFATLKYNNKAKAVTVSFSGLGKPDEITTIKSLPFHVYNFDLASLNASLPHLINPKKSFVVGLADPTFKDAPIFIYRGEATIQYTREEKRNNVVCRRYQIGGAGLSYRGGSIWVNKQHGHIEDMEIDLPDNPEWKSFKLRLTKIEQMNRQEWETFMKNQF